MEPPKFRSLYIFMNKNAHFIILVSFCRPHSDLLFMTNVPSSLVLLSMYKDSEIYRCILNFCLSNTIVLNFWKGPELLVVIISYLYLLERKVLMYTVRNLTEFVVPRKFTFIYFITCVRILLTYKVTASVHLYIHKCPWAFMNI